MGSAELTSKHRIPDELWERLKPLLSPEPAKPKGGRPRMDDRLALESIFYGLSSGCQWNALPCTFGASSTAPDRFQAWRAAGVFERFWQAGLTEYAAEVGIDWEWNALP